MNRLTYLLLFGGLVFLVSGCSRPVGSVTGKVTYQGKPLKGGTVSFASTEGRQSFSASIADDGSYTIPNLVGGSYKVCVETESLKPPPGVKAGMGPGQNRSPAAARTAENLKKYVQIPDKYSSADKTDITYEFKGGSETYNIELK
jgi:hypothetical protein